MATRRSSRIQNNTRTPLESSVNISVAADSLQNHDGVLRENAVASYYENFEDILPGISGRRGFGRDDYDLHRPNEAIPKKYDKIVNICDKMYYSFGLVRYVIDLMADFTCQGVQIIHPTPSIQKFYESWFAKVSGYERSERFCNYLYRHNMVAVRSLTSKINNSKIKEFAIGKEDFKYEPMNIDKREIPLKFVFLPPDRVHPSRSYLLGEKINYVYKDNRGGFQVKDENGVIIKTEQIDLPENKTFVSYFKKDDWHQKPVPFLFPLIKHWIMINKLALADSAALDGAISNVRIWKLCDTSLDVPFIAGPALVEKLDQILRAHTGGGTMDIIWTSPIELIESKTQVHNFLGEEKYKPHLNQLYIGLGVPPTLVGTQGGTTNNYISLKTLVKRLEYGRERLIEFWDKQIKIVQKAMGFAKPATLEFDYLDFAEEAAEKALLIQLADRNIISEQRLQTIFGYDPETERRRLNQELRERNSGRRVPKSSPWHDPQFDISLTKIALQRGFITPEQAGLEIDEEFKDQISPNDKLLNIQKQRQGDSPGRKSLDESKQPKNNGRPRGAKDSQQRERTFKPAIKAALELWCDEANSFIHEQLKPYILKATNKNSLRELNSEQMTSFDKLRFGVLFNIKPMSELCESTFLNAFGAQLNLSLYSEYLRVLQDVAKEYGSSLTVGQANHIKNIIYSNYHENI